MNLVIETSQIISESEKINNFVGRLQSHIKFLSQEQASEDAGIIIGELEKDIKDGLIKKHNDIFIWLRTYNLTFNSRFF